MDFRLSSEQIGFATSLTDLMAGADSVAVARAWAAGDHEPGLALWKRLADQGVSALLVPADRGGMGGTPADLVVAFEMLGNQLAVGPWIESAAFLPTLLPAESAEQLAAGSVMTTTCPPHVPFALDGDVAERVYALDVEERRLLSARAGAVQESVDRTRKLLEVSPGDVVAEALDLRSAFDTAALACAAELLGCGERLLADTVDYAQQRKQYGRLIGSYQAIKHRLADVRIALDFVRPLVHGAALVSEASADERSRSVSAAKVAAGDAAYLASRVALQVHGAIGYTAEFDLGLWIARVRALVGAWGTTSHHRARIARSLAGSL